MLIGRMKALTGRKDVCNRSMRLSDTESHDNKILYISCLYYFVVFYVIFFIVSQQEKCFARKAAAKKAEVTLGVHNGG